MRLLTFYSISPSKKAFLHSQFQYTNSHDTTYNIQNNGWYDCLRDDANMTLKEWVKDAIDTPDYKEKDIKDLGMGDCNMKRARGHIHHFKDSIEILIHEEYPDVYVFHGMTSRYCDTNKKKSKDNRICIIDFEDRELADFDGEYKEYVESIPDGQRLDYMQKGCQYYCTCKSGSRTINPCAHAVAILQWIMLIKEDKLDEWLGKTAPRHYREPMNVWHYKQWKKQQNMDGMDVDSGNGTDNDNGSDNDNNSASESEYVPSSSESYSNSYSDNE